MAMVDEFAEVPSDALRLMQARRELTAERERCAKLCEQYAGEYNGYELAELIRTGKVKGR